MGQGIEGIAGLEEQKTHMLRHFWITGGEVVLTDAREAGDRLLGPENGDT